MLRARQRTQSGLDEGFTLVELAVAVVLVGALLALSVPGWRSYQASQERVSASREIVSVLRNAQMRATAEEATYRVDIDQAGRSLTVFRFDGATYVRRSTSVLDGRLLVLTGTGFRDKSGATTASAYFYPRGTASPGQVTVGREGQAVEHVITVEGLTGRVSTT